MYLILLIIIARNAQCIDKDLNNTLYIGRKMLVKKNGYNVALTTIVVIGDND